MKNTNKMSQLNRKKMSPDNGTGTRLIGKKDEGATNSDQSDVPKTELVTSPVNVKIKLM
jgi:hypothetical protein